MVTRCLSIEILIHEGRTLPYIRRASARYVDTLLDVSLEGSKDPST